MDYSNMKFHAPELNDKILSVDRIIKEFGLVLKNSVDTSNIVITAPKINRLGLQLSGFFDVFSQSRIQLIGAAEFGYIQTLSPERLDEIVDRILSYRVPCVIFSHNQEPPAEFIKYGDKYNVPILTSDIYTSDFILALFNFFNTYFAPEITISGVLIDINGVGTLVRGKSGIGKSEAALELVNRGHRFVADDSVVITRLGDALFGKSPELIKNLMEVRGIGIVDISKLYGIGSVLDTTKIDLVVQMDEFSYETVYDRLGIDETTIDILGVSLPILTIPVKQGRNLAVILESAARNHSLKSMGHNAAESLNQRMRKKRNNEL